MSSDHHPTLHRRPTSNRNSHSPSPPPPPPPPPSSKPNVTTTLYHTHIGIFALTWSRTLFGRSLHLHLLPSAAADDDDDSLSTTSSTHTTNTTSIPSFHLQIKPLIFWNKHGSKKLQISNNKKDFIQIYYDLSRAKFGSSPEPISGFYIAATISTQMILLIGDSVKQAYSKTKLTQNNNSQITVLRREHVTGIANKKYTTKATFRGKTREITIDCSRVSGDDSRLYFSVDCKKILVVKHLQWKFRGNERVEIDGVHIQISWDVYNWLSNEETNDGYALFMFRFEKSGFDYHEDDKYLARLSASGSGVSGFGFGFEMKKMKKGMLKRAKSSSTSSSLSSASSGCGSVMEWESVEENELKGPNGFSLLVYAWQT